MRKIIRIRAVQPDYSIGMITAAVLLVLAHEFYRITWWVLLICICVAPMINALVHGRTTVKEIHIDDDI